MNKKQIYLRAIQISTSLGHLTSQLEGNPNYQYDQSIPWSVDPERDIRLAYTQTISLLESAGMQTSAEMLLTAFKSKEEKGSFLTYCEDQYGETYDDSDTELLVPLAALIAKNGGDEHETIMGTVTESAGELFDFLWPDIGVSKSINDFLFERMGDDDEPLLGSRAIGRVRQYATAFKQKLVAANFHRYEIKVEGDGSSGRVTLKRVSE